MSIADHEQFDRVLLSHERGWSNLAAHHEAEAERARDRKRKEIAKWINPPREHLARLEARYNLEIDHHDREGRKYRRRAEFAKQGYVLASPDENKDAEYQKEHRELIAMAMRTNRLHYSDEPGDLTPAGGASPRTLAEAARGINESHYWPSEPVVPIPGND
jgi:hypothetical protein